MKQVAIEITRKCPNRCVHCSSRSHPGCVEEIPADALVRVIEDSHRLRARRISFSGGEPLLHEGLVDLVGTAKALGIAADVYTSGIALDASGTAVSCAILPELQKAGMDRLIFDIPAVDERLYDRFMGTRGYQRVAFESLDRAVALGVHTEIHFVPARLNVREIDAVLAFAEAKGVHQVSFLGLVPHGRAREAADLMIQGEELRKLKERLDALPRRAVRVGIPLQIGNNECQCYAGREKLCVRYDGRVYGCEAFKHVRLHDSLGNEIFPDSIYERSLAEIYADSPYLDAEREFIRAAMRDRSCQFEKCPVQRKRARSIA